jgi:hypothetical protein
MPKLLEGKPVFALPDKVPKLLEAEAIFVLPD